MTQTQLTLAQRYTIYVLLQARISKRRIAKRINVHHSTVYREIARNSVNGKYNYTVAETKRIARRREAKKYNKISGQTWKLVEKFLKQEFSPEQIAGFFSRSGFKIISHESIYQYVLADQKKGGTLHKHLRWSRKRRRKRYGKHDRRGQIPDRISIEERPLIVAEKGRLGDWEIDTAIGKGHQGVLIIAVERKSKLTVIGWSRYKRADLVSKEIIRILKPYKHQVLTITVDNGREFAQHKTIAKALKADVYFAHPYSAWERGLNENTVGLLRQYFSKNMSFKSVSTDMIQFVQQRLNTRPRKTLGFQSPIEVYFNAVAFGT